MSAGPRLVLRNVEVGGRSVDVAVEGDRVVAMAPGLPVAPGADVIDGRGGALLPGLHDHHLHLLGAAAAMTSVPTGPAAVRDRAGLEQALRAADAALAPGGWLRAVGYHERVAGDLDRDALDRIVGARPVRVQHRSGARWTFNSAAIEALELGARTHPGIERDHQGRPTGRLHRGDDLLRDLLPATGPPEFAALGAALVRYGVTGVTDTTPSRDLEALAPLAAAVTRGELPQRVMVTGGPALTAAGLPAGLERGPVKVLVDDAAYPALAELAGHIALAHRHDRAVAIHCVTRTALVLALAAWDEAGSRPGDRVEHGSVIPPELFGALARHGLTVVTQPGFVGERGDEYLQDAGDDLADLYRCRTLLDAGIPVAASTDAPYTSLDPWAAMRAAVTRATPSGAVVGPDEAVTPTRALALFLGELTDPGDPPRVVAPGARADLCLLAHPLATVLARLRADDVVATICAGRVVHPAALSRDPRQ